MDDDFVTEMERALTSVSCVLHKYGYECHPKIIIQQDALQHLKRNSKTHSFERVKNGPPILWCGGFKIGC